MKLNFNTIWQLMVSYLSLDKFSWILFGISFIINIILWIVWYKIHFNVFSIILVTTILVINFILTILFDSKGQIISYLLLGVGLLCQILLSVLLINSVYF